VWRWCASRLQEKVSGKPILVGLWPVENTVLTDQSVFDNTIEFGLLRPAPDEPAGLIDDELIEQVCRAAIIAAKF
jgi:hypothetical protein